MDWIQWGLQVLTIIALFIGIILLGVVLPLYLVWTGGWYGILGLFLYATLKALSLVYFTDSK